MLLHIKVFHFNWDLPGKQLNPLNNSKSNGNFKSQEHRSIIFCIEGEPEK